MKSYFKKIGRQNHRTFPFSPDGNGTLLFANSNGIKGWKLKGQIKGTVYSRKKLTLRLANFVATPPTTFSVFSFWPPEKARY